MKCCAGRHRAATARAPQGTAAQMGSATKVALAVFIILTAAALGGDHLEVLKLFLSINISEYQMRNRGLPVNVLFRNQWRC
jgi:hypothetical protein